MLRENETHKASLNAIRLDHDEGLLGHLSLLDD